MDGIRCKRRYLDKNGKLRICNKKLGEIDGRYRIRCPRCHAIVTGDTRVQNSQRQTKE